MVICIHCLKSFKSQNSMIIHQKKTKYCLKIQQIQCKFCDQKVGRNLNIHLTKCLKKVIFEQELEIKELKLKLKNGQPENKNNFNYDLNFDNFINTHFQNNFENNYDYVVNKMNFFFSLFKKIL